MNRGQALYCPSFLGKGDECMYEERIDGEAEPIRLLSADELYGICNKSEDHGHFVLDLDVAREERVEEILRNNWMKEQSSRDERREQGSGNPRL
jgi:hypothetical protein